jgi:hypothetical protein
LTARTLTVYVPGPTTPVSVRAVVGNRPVNAPVTFTSYRVGAAPPAAGVQVTDAVLPDADANKLIGVCGDPEHVVGNVSVTGFDDPLDPNPFVARTLNV